jgi:hypothetical protein
VGGSAHDDWVRAEAEILAERALEEQALVNVE